MRPILYLKQRTNTKHPKRYDFDKQLELIFSDEYDIVCGHIEEEMPPNIFDPLRYKVIIVQLNDEEYKLSPSCISLIISYISNGGNLFIFNFYEGSFYNHELSLIQGGSLGERLPLTVADYQKTQYKHKIVSETDNFSLEEAPSDFRKDPFVNLFVLLECLYGNDTYPVFWYRNYFGGRVLSLSLGNPFFSLQNGEISKIIRRTIFWLFDMI